LARGFVIAAPASGSGKTVVTLGLMAALRRSGLAVAPAKTGPDYIDTAFLARAAGADALNLDPWAMSSGQLRARAAGHAAGQDLLMIEGVMGLFDGAAGGRGSTADLAADLGLPVVLVVDAARQSQSVAALVSGFANWRTDVNVGGIVLNRVGSERHRQLLTDALEPLGIPVIGAIPRREELRVPGRHLGLVLPGEVEGVDDFLAAASRIMAESCDIDRLRGLACRVGDAAPPDPLPPLGQHVAIARDAAFAFLYRHWLTDWRVQGATTSFFSPLADEAPDPEADAVFLPGGYPELHGAALAGASRFREGLAAARDRGALIYGECGGYMVLGSALTDSRGVTHPMAGLLPHTTSMRAPGRVLGYRHLHNLGPLPFPGMLRGHEFHYSTGKGGEGAAPLFAARDAAGRALPAMGGYKGRVAGSYAHIIDCEAPA